MELRHLRYFVAVAEALNFRVAAQRLYMTQPSLSRQIQELEREIGVPLFRRVKRHIELTPAGNAFLRETRLTLAQAEQAAEAARQANQQERRSLHISACFGLTRYSHTFDSAFARSVRAFRERHPGIGLTLREYDDSRQEQELREGRADIGFSCNRQIEGDLVSELLLQEPLVLVLPQDHRLSGDSKVSLTSLSGEHLFLFEEAISPVFHQKILDASERAGLRPKSVQVAESLQKALWLVGAGLGVTFVGASIAETQPPGVVLRPARDFTLSLEIAAFWRQDSKHPLLAEFVELAKEMLGQSSE